MTLTIIAALPLLGALLIALLGNSQKENIKKLALLISILTFVATVLITLNLKLIVQVSSLLRSTPGYLHSV